jgi:hypothetical protein
MDFRDLEGTDNSLIRVTIFAFVCRDQGNSRKISVYWPKLGTEASRQETICSGHAVYHFTRQDVSSATTGLRCTRA